MTGIDFRVLGPLQLGGENQCVHLRSRRQQVMLAALLLNPNRLVTVDSLINAVWDDHPPHGARHQLQNCAWKLRCRLRDLGVAQAVIVGHPAGYVLRFHESRLDVTVFDRQVAEARELAAAGRVEAAARTLRAALSLWQGPPLLGVPGRVMQREAARLTERRLLALEDWVDLELAVGRSAEVTAELQHLVHEYPFRERFRAQLMLSLYRSGRVAEALATYRQTRQLFVDELGLEPGPMLRGLEEAILRDDESLWRSLPARDVVGQPRWSAEPYAEVLT